MNKPPGRPNQGKSETLRKRSVYVYLPTEEMVAQWKAEAGKYGMSLSRFLVEVVDDVIQKNPSGLTPREEIKAELAKVSSELAAVQADRESLRSLLAKSEENVAGYRASSRALFEGTHDDNKLSGLIRLFRQRRVWRIDQVPAALGIDVADEVAMSWLQDGIDHLKQLGLIEGDFDELRCTIGKRKMLSPEIKKKRRAKKMRSISRRLQAARHDSNVGGIIRVEPS